MRKDRIAKRVYVGESIGSLLVGRSQRRWLDSVNDFLKERGLNVGQARKVVKIGMNGGGLKRGIARGINPCL